MMISFLLVIVLENLIRIPDKLIVDLKKNIFNK